MFVVVLNLECVCFYFLILPLLKNNGKITVFNFDRDKIKNSCKLCAAFRHTETAHPAQTWTLFWTKTGPSHEWHVRVSKRCKNQTVHTHTPLCVSWCLSTSGEPGPLQCWSDRSTSAWREKQKWWSTESSPSPANIIIIIYSSSRSSTSSSTPTQQTGEGAAYQPVNFQVFMWSCSHRPSLPKLQKPPVKAMF